MRLKNLVPTAAKLQLFKAEILPYLTYAILLGISAERVISENSKVFRRGVCAQSLGVVNLHMRSC